MAIESSEEEYDDFGVEWVDDTEVNQAADSFLDPDVDELTLEMLFSLQSNQGALLRAIVRRAKLRGEEIGYERGREDGYSAGHADGCEEGNRMGHQGYVFQRNGAAIDLGGPPNALTSSRPLPPSRSILATAATVTAGVAVGRKIMSREAERLARQIEYHAHELAKEKGPVLRKMHEAKITTLQAQLSALQVSGM
jgi:hypothetical protein